MAELDRAGHTDSSDDTSSSAATQQWKWEGGSHMNTRVRRPANPSFSSQRRSPGSLHPRSTESNPSSPTVSHSTSLVAVAGGAAAVGIVVTALVGLAIYYCLRRKSVRRVGRPMQISLPLHNPGHDPSQIGRGSMTLPCYTVTSSTRSSPRLPFSPASAYISMTLEKDEPLELQEIMGVGLTEEEYNRRFKSRTPVNALDGPVELATLRYSAADIYAAAGATLFKPVAKPSDITTERSSRLRTSPASGNLRALAVSRSPSISPVRSDDLG